MKRLLEAYAQRLNSVEVNYTFRAVPSPATLENWLRDTSSDFRFSFKAPQRISHFQRLRNCGPLFAEFARTIEPIREAGRLGIVLLQLPPNFAADTGLLDGFLAEATISGLRLAFEFRHPSWFQGPEAEATFAVLRTHQAALCIAEADELTTPEVHTAPFSVYRLRRSAYSEAGLDEVARRLIDAAAEGEVFAYFKHEEEPDGPLRAARVLAQMGLAAGARPESGAPDAGSPSSKSPAGKRKQDRA